MNGNDTIYVVGTDGQLHGFATPKQFLGDGYDPALVTTVPNLGGLGVGSNAGTTLTALATKADGAIVISSGTFYTFAGGKGFGIPTQAALDYRSGRPTRPGSSRVRSARPTPVPPLPVGPCSVSLAPYTSATRARCTPSRRRRSWPMMATVAPRLSRRLTPAASRSFSPIQVLSFGASLISPQLANARVVGAGGRFCPPKPRATVSISLSRLTEGQPCIKRDVREQSPSADLAYKPAMLAAF